MRTFIALTFDNELKERLGKIQRVLKDEAVKGRWVYINNLHLTLKFLGNIDPKDVNRIKTVLGDIAKQNKELELSLNELGFFPGKDILRVVWLGIDGDMENLNSIHNQVEWGLKKLGYPKDKRKFKPHITLGRDVVFNTTIYNLKELLREDLEYKFKLNTIKLMKSEEKQGKRIYTPLGSFRLNRE
jgi:2'-5' RNA ligase